MEGRVWEQLREAIARLPVPEHLDRRCTYPTRLVLLVAAYAYFRDRPQNWACDPANWPPGERPRALPHPGQLSRRLNAPAALRLWEALWQAAGDGLGPPARGTAAVDGKAMTVGGHCRDRDAGRGRAHGSFGWGYKLHAVTDAAGRLVAAEVLPLNRNEMPVAAGLLRRAAPRLRPGTTVVGDGEYVADYLYSGARECGLLFLAPFLNDRLGRNACDERRGGYRTLHTPRGRRMLRERVGVERAFSRLGATSFGFKGLPPWARGLRYVRRLVAAKIAAYHCYLKIAAG